MKVVDLKVVSTSKDGKRQQVVVHVVDRQGHKSSYTRHIKLNSRGKWEGISIPGIHDWKLGSVVVCDDGQTTYPGRYRVEWTQVRGKTVPVLTSRKINFSQFIREINEDNRQEKNAFKEASLGKLSPLKAMDLILDTDAILKNVKHQKESSNAI